MNKVQFEKFVLKNLDNIKQINCYITERCESDNEEYHWLDVYIEGDEFTTIFCSEDYPVGSKEVLKLRDRWKKKLESWINPNWGIPLVVDKVTV